MIGLLWLGCVGSETLNTQNVTEPSADVEATDWKLIFGTSMDGDIEPCG